MSSFFLKLFSEKRLVKSVKFLPEIRLVKSVKFLPLSIKSINPIQKYPHITESHAMFLPPINTLISLGICFIPKEW